MKKILVLTLALICGLGANAQRTNWEKLLHNLNSSSKSNGRELVVTMRMPGELAKKLTPQDCETVNFLRVNGPMDKKDLILITELARRKETRSREGKMVPARIDLDLQNAFIVEESSSFLNSRPKHITVLPADLFKRAIGLRSIILPNDIVEVGRNAFTGCSNLEYVYLPDNVRVIARGAFEDDSRLNNVDMPNGIVRIDDYAFAGCSNLTEIRLPSMLNTIGSYAFSRSGLKFIDLPESVESIGSSAFASTRIQNIYIPSRVKELVASIFSSCGSLKNIEVSPENPAYQSIDGVLFNKEGNKLLYYPYARTEAYVVPQGTESIGTAAFANSNAESITLPSSCQSIGEEAFYSSRIKSIDIPEGVVAISKKTFDECGELMLATLPSTLQTIGDEAFRGCKKLARIDIPESVTTIGEEAFRACFAFTEITIPANVKVVGEKAFYYCKNTQAITMLGSVPPAAKKPSNNEKKVKLIVPTGCVDVYKSASGWKDIKKIEEDK